MDFFNWFYNFIIHNDSHLTELAGQYEKWTYVSLFLIFFSETGLVLTPFLPGDSLLFTVGTLAAEKINCLNVHKMLLLISIAAILGDTCNYIIGKFFGNFFLTLIHMPSNKDI